MYKIKVDNRFDFNFEKINHVWQLEGQDVFFDVLEIQHGFFHVLKNNKSYTVEIVNHQPADKTFQLKVNQTLYTLQVKDKYDELLHRLGLDKAMISKVSNIKAPMPGLVLNVLITEGQEVKKGDALLVLEAMKMENILKSPTDGQIKKIGVKKGQAVEKGQVLIEFI